MRFTGISHSHFPDFKLFFNTYTVEHEISVLTIFVVHSWQYLCEVFWVIKVMSVFYRLECFLWTVKRTWHLQTSNHTMVWRFSKWKFTIFNSSTCRDREVTWKTARWMVWTFICCFYPQVHVNNYINSQVNGKALHL